MVEIREISPSDSIKAITELLHSAYARLNDMGMRFYASHQSEEETQNRIISGETFVATIGLEVVGIVTLYNTLEECNCEWYCRPGVWHFGQFAVSPARQKNGIGSALLKHIEGHCIRQGGIELALDTAETAHELIAYYSKRGFRKVGTVDWEVTNYLSVAMSKRL